MNGGIVALDGSTKLETIISGKAQEAVKLGEDLANSILAKGGKEMLAAIKKELGK